MVKYDISGNDEVVEISRQEFLILLAKFSDVCFGFARSYIVNHASGLADFKNEYFKVNENRIRKQYFFAKQEITNNELKGQLDQLFEIINKLSIMDDQIIASYREAIMQKKMSKKPIKDLKLEVKKYLFQDHNLPPIKVKKIAEDTAMLVPELEKIYKMVNAKIDQLLLLEDEEA